MARLLLLAWLLLSGSTATAQLADEVPLADILEILDTGTSSYLESLLHNQGRQSLPR